MPRLYNQGDRVAVRLAQNLKTIAFVGSWLTLHLLSPAIALAGSAPLVIAWQAPDCYSGNPSWCSAFIQSELPYISGIGVAVKWSAVDNCYTIGSNPLIPCLPDSTCTPGTNTNCYKWSVIDNNLNAYITNAPMITGWNWSTGCAGGQPCKIVIIIEPEVDSGNINDATPDYVFSTHYAGTLPGSPNPQDLVVCSGFKGDISGMTLPVVLGSGGWNADDFAIWNVNSCAILGGSDLSCSLTLGPYSDFSGYPIVYEKPILTAYQALLSAVAGHYSAVGRGDGPEISPYLAYVRAGMASGGENNPMCNTSGAITSAPWSTPLSVTAGYVIQPSGSGNAGNYRYVADSGGATGSTAPTWCQIAGCYTSADGTITRWHNVGYRSTGSALNIIWPGPQGQFTPSTEQRGYSDNGYLTTWPSPDGTGYVAAMMQFLATLNASFPWTVSSHAGPSSSGIPPNDYAYADAEALLAAQSSIGFGMQSLNIEDPVTSPLGIYPTSRQDWVANFQKYPNAPVHHLQLNAPGSEFFWPGYEIYNITVTGTEATITCTSSFSFSDCSPLAGQQIYVSGNSNISLNGIWLVNCTGPMGACSTNQLQFSVGSSFPGPPTGSGGIVWSPNYWPITMPFALQHGASSLEVWECDLDYAFGQQTTTTVSNEISGAGCPEWGLVGPYLTYQNAIQNTLLGEPAVTSFHSDHFTYSWHF